MIPLFGKMYFGRIQNIIKTFLQLRKDFPNVLDIGGGLGLFSLNFKLNFPKSDVYILDEALYDGIKATLTKNTIIKINDYIQGDIQKRTIFNDNRFDLIFALDVLEDVDNPSDAIDEIMRILKKNGFLFVSVPTESMLLRVVRTLIGTVKNIQVNPHWLGLISSEKEFFNVLSQKNLKIISKRYFPFKFLPRLFSYDVFYLIQKIRD